MTDLMWLLSTQFLIDTNQCKMRDRFKYILNVNLFLLKYFSWVANKTTGRVTEGQDVQSLAVQLDVQPTLCETDFSAALRHLTKKKKKVEKKSSWRCSCQCPFQSSALVRLQINVVTKLGVELDLQVAQQLLDGRHSPLKTFDLLLQIFLLAFDEIQRALK